MRIDDGTATLIVNGRSDNWTATTQENCRSIPDKRNKLCGEKWHSIATFQFGNKKYYRLEWEELWFERNGNVCMQYRFFHNGQQVQEWEPQEVTKGNKLVGKKSSSTQIRVTIDIS